MCSAVFFGESHLCFSHVLAAVMLAFVNVCFLGQEADLNSYFMVLISIIVVKRHQRWLWEIDGSISTPSQSVISPSWGADIIVSETTICHSVSVLGKPGFFKTDD